MTNCQGDDPTGQVWAENSEQQRAVIVDQLRTARKRLILLFYFFRFF